MIIDDAVTSGPTVRAPSTSSLRAYRSTAAVSSTVLKVTSLSSSAVSARRGCERRSIAARRRGAKRHDFYVGVDTLEPLHYIKTFRLH